MRATHGALILLLAAATALAACKKETPRMVDSAPPPQVGSRPWKIANARSAAPPEISANATVMDIPATDSTPGERLITGENGWVCTPDDPGTDANDPFCADEQGQKWMAAWAVHQPPRLTGMAIGYALQGGVSASDTDPFKMRPDSGKPWIIDPPYIAIAMPNSRAYAGLPTTRRSDGPWLRFRGTPYAYIVIPATAASATGRAP